MSTLYCAVHESEIGPSRTFLLSQRTSAFRGKPDTKVLTFSTRYSAAQFAILKITIAVQRRLWTRTNWPQRLSRRSGQGCTLALGCGDMVAI